MIFGPENIQKYNHGNRPPVCELKKIEKRRTMEKKERQLNFHFLDLSFSHFFFLMITSHRVKLTRRLFPPLQRRVGQVSIRYATATLAIFKLSDHHVSPTFRQHHHQHDDHRLLTYPAPEPVAQVRRNEYDASLCVEE